jgi:hypothetical protein
MFATDYFAQDYYAPDYFPPGVITDIEITLPQPPPGGGDSRGGLSYKPSYKPKYKPLELPAEQIDENLDQILREDQEILEFIEVILAMGILE